MKIALPLARGRVRVVSPEEIYYLEAERHDTRVRMAGRRTVSSSRPLSEWERQLRKHGFVRVHRSWLVNVERIRELRTRADDDNDWELKLEPPVNRVLPVSREGLARLRRALGF